MKDDNSRGSCPVALSRNVPRFSVIELLREQSEAYRRAHPRLIPEHERLLRDLQVCRTAALGGHVFECDSCDYKVPVYNSCRNRSCPQCQALDQARWIEARSKRLLPVGHHHVVFTVPQQLRAVARAHPRAFFKIMFTAVRETLMGLSATLLGMQPGVTAVLHTRTRELLFHPHVHCIVTAGGLSLDSSHWIHRQGFLLPVALMKACFRGRIIHHVDRLAREGKLGLDDTSRQTLLRSLPRAKRWNLHIEQPFGRSTHVLQYLGRYTHRIAISDFRLVKLDSHSVTFRTRGEQTITLPALVFMERYMQHVLPPGLHKIRHFGLYAAANVNRKLPVASQILSSAGLNNDDNQASERRGLFGHLLHR